MNSNLILLVVLIVVTTVIATTTTTAAYATQSAAQHYQIGYNDGCNGVVVPGKHTAEYLTGYSDGVRACRVSEHNSVVSNANSNSNSNDNSARQTVIINEVPVK